MNSIRLDISVAFFALIFCLEVATLFGVLYRRDRSLQEHLVFSLFNLALAGMVGCRLLLLTDPPNRYVALRAFQWHGAAACAVVVTFVHFTCLITEHPVRKYLLPRVLYPLGVLMAALFFMPSILHVAPANTRPHEIIDREMGFLFPGYSALLLACGTMPCYLLLSTARKLRGSFVLSSPPQDRIAGDLAGADDTPDLVLLRRHLRLIFLGTLTLMAFILVDLAWLLSPVPDPPLPFTAVGIIFLSLTTALVLGKDMVRSEQRRLRFMAVAEARLTALMDAQHQLKNQIDAVGRPLQTAMRVLQHRGGREQERATLETKIVLALQENAALEETLNIMLNVARLEAGEPLHVGDKASVDLVTLLETLGRKRASLSAPPRVDQYRLETACPVTRFWLYETPLTLVLINLLDNAFKYSPYGSPVIARLSVEAGGQTLRVQVCDQGAGVPLADQERIFSQPFYRGRAETRRTPGTGLGLNMARRYAEEMQGKLWVESAGEGHGSVFVLTLPCEPDDSRPGVKNEAK